MKINESMCIETEGAVAVEQFGEGDRVDNSDNFMTDSAQDEEEVPTKEGSLQSPSSGKPPPDKMEEFLAEKKLQKALDQPSSPFLFAGRGFPYPPAPNIPVE